MRVLTTGLFWFAVLLLKEAGGTFASEASSVLGGEGSLKLGAFNVRIFGRTKMENPSVRNSLVQIVARYHLVLIQEVRDSEGTAIVDLMKMINGKYNNTFSLSLSPRLGRTSSKEQYAFIFRNDIFKVMDSYVFDDQSDRFEREPYLIAVRSPYLNYALTLIGIHTSPDNAKQEISALWDVYQDARQRWQVENIMLLGDFNGACDYISDWSQVQLAKKGSGLYWLITDATDTTSGNTNCAYDRIVVSGVELTAGVDPYSPKAFHYDRYLGLSYSQALAVSDHYPVEVELRTASEMQDMKITSLYKVRNEALSSFSKSVVYAIKKDAEARGKYQVNSLFTKTGAYDTIRIETTSNGTSNAIKELRAMHSSLGTFLTPLQVKIAERYIRRLKMSNVLETNSNYDTLASFYASRQTSVTVALVFFLRGASTATWLEISAPTAP